MSSVKCFWMEDLRVSRYRLRRYAGEGKCTEKMGYHNAMSAVVAEAPEDPEKDHAGTRPPTVEETDPRWPTACACGYAFTEGDTRQIFSDSVYRRADTGELLTREEAPAGAMWDASWWPDKGPDGICLMVKLPDGCEWMVDGPSTNSKTPWARTGKPPAVTATPSILTNGYHGFLTNGSLVSC
ncbi:MAG TPA: hypothetical protein VNX15_11505 [Gemmatimonadales bacterium]|jgi:hypothetical protein|nr:hypothetical protein [Gemmatimonadales bacterium]